MVEQTGGSDEQIPPLFESPKNKEPYHDIDGKTTSSQNRQGTSVKVNRLVFLAESPVVTEKLSSETN